MQISIIKIAILTDLWTKILHVSFSLSRCHTTNCNAVNTALLDRRLGFIVMKGTELCFHFAGSKRRLVRFNL